MDTKLTSEMFRNTNVCTHSYCFDCIRGHVAAKIKENITQVKCPHLQCKGLIGPEICRSIVPKEVLERWENSLCESMILASEKITYCPFKDCSAMLVDDGAETVTSSVCPNCNRLFCASCNVVWHSGFDCNEFRGLKKGEKDPEDLKLMDLAKRKKWKRCPNCKYFVEKVSGCLHISCSVEEDDYAEDDNDDDYEDRCEDENEDDYAEDDNEDDYEEDEDHCEDDENQV
ncbi:probable E3 ubiquitin-protein ligase ARI9 [Cynara cardunculus var. scolymus]|uniref:probable E3 ubiquitin-protein ligase ARI9 n=1 Tax=Cynara cardunculus var. scolymus TaxID=59895 RepID=UPI000D630F99|nr:probable E3 ubiquitin-protein ligase ARI9 [Cynara cardunculus var. scolymus]